MTLKTTAIHALSFKTERDLIVVNVLSASLIAVIAYFPNSPVRIILGIPFILFFPGYVLICALFPRKEDLDGIERQALSFGISIVVTPLLGFALNYTPFGIRLYPVTFSLFSFMLLMSAVAIYRRRISSSEDVFAPLSQMSISGCLERVKSEFIKSCDGNRILKIAAIIAFIFITIALILIRNSPATGYEVSIYAATPILAWFFLISSLACGIGIAVYEVYLKDENRNKFWAISLLLILLFSLAILYLHHIRGYAHYGSGDVATHVRYLNEILLSGQFEVTNIYPITHILTVQLSQVLEIEGIVLCKCIPPVFYILYGIFMYLFARALLPSRDYAILATLAGLAIVRGYIGFYPCWLTVLLIPMALYLFCKSYTPTATKAKTSFTILFIIILILFPVSHPIPAIVLILLLLTIWLPGKVSGLLSRSSAIPPERSYKFCSAACLVLIIWFISWISSFYVWDATIRNFHFLLTEGGPTNIDALKGQMRYAESYGYSVWEQFFKMYSSILVYIGLTLAAVPVLIKRMRKDKRLEPLFAFYAPFMAFMLIVLFGYYSNTIGLTRILIILLIFCSLFVGFLLYEGLRHKFNRKLWRNACLCCIILLLISICTEGVLKVYPSPYLLSPNDQVTDTEIKGMVWFYHSKNVTTPWLSITISPFRSAHRFLTSEECAGRKDISGSMKKVNMPPFHFGYRMNDSIGDTYETDHYMALKKEDRVLYTEIWPEMAELRFLASDFEQLENDASVDKLYSNDGFDAYFIRARIP